MKGRERAKGIPGYGRMNKAVLMIAIDTDRCQSFTEGRLRSISELFGTLAHLVEGEIPGALWLHSPKRCHPSSSPIGVRSACTVP